VLEDFCRAILPLCGFEIPSAAQDNVLLKSAGLKGEEDDPFAQ
jgi:hypothetical protein